MDLKRGLPLRGKMSEGQLLAMDSTPNQPVRPSNPSLVATELPRSPGISKLWSSGSSNSKEAEQTPAN
jgi:hypothetical protein